MNENQLFEKLDKQYREERDAPYYFVFTIDEDLDGLINLTELIYKILKKNQIMDDDDFTDGDGIYRGNNPYSADKIDFSVIIHANFDHLVVNSSIDSLQINPFRSYKERKIDKNVKKIKGKSIIFKNYSDLNFIKKTIKIEIEYSEIDIIEIKYNLEKFVGNEL